MESRSQFEEIPNELIFEILEKNPDLIGPLTSADPRIYNFVYGSKRKIFNLLVKNTRRLNIISSGDEYSEGTTILTGVKDGIWKTYREKGCKYILILRTRYKMGKINGHTKTYTFFGNKRVLTSNIMYIDDVPNGEALSIEYSSRRKSEIKGDLVDGKFIGEWITTNVLYKNNTISKTVTYFYDDGRVTTPTVNHKVYTPLCIEGFYDGQLITNNNVNFTPIGRSLKFRSFNKSRTIEIVKCINGDTLEYDRSEREMKFNELIKFRHSRLSGNIYIHFRRNRSMENYLCIDENYRIRWININKVFNITFNDVGKVLRFDRGNDYTTRYDRKTNIMEYEAIYDMPHFDDIDTGDNDFEDEYNGEYVKVKLKFLSVDNDLYVTSINLFHGEFKTVANKLEKVIINLYDDEHIHRAVCTINNGLINISKDGNSFVYTDKLEPVSFSAMADTRVTGRYEDEQTFIYSKYFGDDGKQIYRYKNDILHEKITTYPGGKYVSSILRCDTNGLYLHDIETFKFREKKL